MAENDLDDKIRLAGPGPADNAAEADNTVESARPRLRTPPCAIDC